MAKKHYNYHFILSKVNDLIGSHYQDKAKILDYGCGKGVLVQMGLKANLDFYGTELFSYGSGMGIKAIVEKNPNLNNRIQTIEHNKVPFPDNTFDIVVSNQVFEHVPDLSWVISEISRVLKPGGTFLVIFPHYETWREGHCEIPFAHRFQNNPKLQYLWLYSFKVLGFGRRKKEKKPKVWANFFVQWLKENTYYRKYSELMRLFSPYFERITGIEEEYIHYRLEEAGYKSISRITQIPLGKQLTKFACKKLGSLVLVMKKKDN